MVIDVMGFVIDNSVVFVRVDREIIFFIHNFVHNFLQLLFTYCRLIVKVIVGLNILHLVIDIFILSHIQSSSFDNFLHYEISLLKNHFFASILILFIQNESPFI